MAQLAAPSGSPSYESTGSYIVRPRAVVDAERIQATAMLNGTVRIDATFARIAESELILDRALASLAAADTDAERGFARVDATITRSANIVSISARTARPDTARDLATAVGAETIRYIEQLAGLYELATLDLPSEARRSSSDVSTGRVLGAGLVGLGIGMATRPHLRRCVSRIGASADSRLDTGIGNERYTRLRLREERSRTDGTGAPFHLLVLHPDVPVHGGDITAMAGVLSGLLRPEDHVGHLRAARPPTFVAIIPGRTDEDLAGLVMQVREAAIERLRRRYGPHAFAMAHSCRYEAGAFQGDPAAIIVAESL